MAASVLVTGAVHHYIQSNDGVSYYLGTAETTPDIRFNPRKLGVLNDLSSRELPFDETDAGIDAVVSTVLTRFDQNVVDLAVHFGQTSTGGLIGVDSRLTRGSLVIGRQTYRLILQFSFFGTANAVATLKAGYRFYAARCAGYVASPVGTEARKVGLVFQCLNVYNPSNGSFSLFDQNNDISTAYTPN